VIRSRTSWSWLPQPSSRQRQNGWPAGSKSTVRSPAVGVSRPKPRVPPPPRRPSRGHRLGNRSASSGVVLRRPAATPVPGSRSPVGTRCISVPRRGEDRCARLVVTNGPPEQLGVEPRQSAWSGASIAVPHHIPFARDRTSGPFNESRNAGVASPTLDAISDGPLPERMRLRRPAVDGREPLTHHPRGGVIVPVRFMVNVPTLKSAPPSAAPPPVVPANRPVPPVTCHWPVPWTIPGRSGRRHLD
jgi:hypothetical protein